MKFFIFMYCTAHLLTGIASRRRRTTPMPSSLRSNNAEARQVANFAEIINFVNSVPDNDGGRFFRRHRPSKRQDSRRLNEVMAALYGFADLKKFHDDMDNGASKKDINEKVRYHIIDNPEVLMDYKAKQKINMEGTSDQVHSPVDAYEFSTTENKFNETDLEVTHDNPKGTSQDNATVHLKKQDNVQKLTNIERPYRPSFPVDEDDDQPITEGIGIALINNEKQNSEPRADEVDHDERRSEINKNDEFKKRTHKNTPSSKEDKARIDKKKADTQDLKGTSTKKEEDKEYRSTQFIYSQEKLIEDRIRPKHEVDDKLNKEDGNTNENKDRDKNPKEKSLDVNEKNLTSVERLIFKVNNKINKNHDRAEQYSIYSHKERRENSDEYPRKSHEERDKYDKRKKVNYYDKRGERESQWIKVDNQKDYKESSRDKHDDKWSKKERDLDKYDDKWSKKERDLDKKHDKWSKKEKGLDEHYGRGSKKEKELYEKYDRGSKKEKELDEKYGRGSKKEKELDENYDRGSKKEKKLSEIDDEWSKKEKDWDEMNDRWSKKEQEWDEIDENWKKKEKLRDKNEERWTKKTKYWNNKKRDHVDKDVDAMEYEWNKRHQEYDKYENDAQWQDNDREGNENNFKERDNDFKKRDSEFHERDNDWTKRDSGGNKNIGRTYDRNESGNKKSHESVDYDRVVRHDRYKIVDRIDSDSSRNDDYERTF